MRKFSFILLFVLISLQVSLFAQFNSDSIYRSSKNKNLFLQTRIDLPFIYHNHDGTYDGNDVFINYESPLWPALLIDFFENNHSIHSPAFLKLHYIDQNAWSGDDNQLSWIGDTIHLRHSHTLLKENRNMRGIRNEIFALFDYAVLHKTEIKKLQHFRVTDTNIQPHRPSISEKKMLEIINDIKTKEHILQFFRHTPRYDYFKYPYANHHNLETDSLLSSYFQNDSIHLVNRRTQKVIFKSPEISNFIKVGHYNYIFQPILDSDPVFNYNAKMNTLLILTEPELKSKYIYAYHDSSNLIFGIGGANQDLNKERGLYYIDKLTMSPCQMDYIFSKENEAPKYLRNVFYENCLKWYPPPAKSYSQYFAYLGICFLLLFIIWFIKLNMTTKH